MTDRSRSTYRFFTYPHQRQRSVPEQILEPTTIYRRGGIDFDCGFEDAALSPHWGIDLLNGATGALDSTIAGRTGTNAARLDLTNVAELQTIYQQWTARAVSVATFRFRVSTLPAGSTRVWKFNGASVYDSSITLASNGVLQFVMGGTAANSAGPIVANTWYRIDVAVDGTNKIGRWSIDGVAQTDPGSPASTDTNNGIYLGKSSLTATGAFSYYFDDVAVSTTWADYPIGPGSVQTPYAPTVLPDAPVAYWQLGEASGNPQDASGNAHHVTVVGGTPTYGQTGPIIGTTAVEFDGSTEYFTAPSGIDVADVFTLEAWVIPGATGASRGIICLSDGQYLRILNTGELTLNQASVGIIVRSTVNPSAGVWNHVVATKNGATVKLYINGVDVTGTVTNQTFVSFAGIAHIAESNSSSERFNGSIGQAAVYDTALTATQVAAHYASAEAWFQSFTADAVVKKTVSGSFTANAVIRKTIYSRATIAFTCGAEHTSEFTTSHWFSYIPNAGAVTVDTTHVDSSPNAIKITADAYLRKIANTGTYFAARLRIWLPSGAASGTRIIELDDGAQRLLVYSTVAGKMQWYNGTDSTAAFPLDQWVTVDLEIDASANPHVSNWRINGVAQPQATAAVAANNVVQYYVGAGSGGVGSDRWVDNFAVSLTPGDYPIGPGSAQKPASTEEWFQGFTADAYIKSTVAGSFTANAVITKTMQPYRGVVLGDVPVAYWRLGESGTPATAVHVCGAECSGLGTHWSITGAVTTDTTIKRNGTGSMKVAATGSGISAQATLGSATHKVVRLSLYLNALPSASAMLALAVSNAQANAYLGFDVATGKLTVSHQGSYASRTQATTTIQAQRWYTLDLDFDNTAGAPTIRWRIDGVAQTTHVGAGPTGTFENFLIGQGDAGQIPDTTYTAYFDDIVISHTAADYPIAFGAVAGTSPETWATALDSSGTQHGFYVASPTLGVTGVLTGDADTAVTFNGTNQQITVANSSPFRASGTATFSIEAWFKHTGDANYRQVVSCMNGSAAGWEFYHYHLGGSADIGFHRSAYADAQGATAQLVANSWHHFAGTYDGTNVRFYLDGVLIDTTASATGMPSDSTFKIGGDTVFWNGTIDEVAFYNTELTATQVKTHYITAKSGTVGFTADAIFVPSAGGVATISGSFTANAVKKSTITGSFTANAVLRKTMQPYRGLIVGQQPIAYWRLGESSGSTAAAVVGPTGTYVNTPTLGVTGLLTGDPDTAVTFVRASDEYVSVPTGMAAGASAGASMSARISLASITALHFVLRWGPQNASPGYHVMFIDAGGSLRWQYAATSDWFDTSSPALIAAGTTYHVAVSHTYATKQVSFYINGVLVGVEDESANPAPLVPPANAATFIGAYAGTLQQFDGTLDEVTVFSRPLTAAEVLEQYITAKGGIVGFTADASLVKTTTGTITANAVIRRTQTSSTTADAVKRSTVAGSLTADAVKKSTVAGSFTANAALKKTTSGTFLADAVKKSTAAGSTTANAVLFRATQTGSFTANAAKVRTITGTFTANATILRTQTGSFTANAAIKATLSGSTTANAVKFKANQLGSLTANAIKRQTFSGSWTADATLKRTQLGSLTANAVIFASRAGSTTANAVIMPRFAADAIIRRTQTGSFVGSAVIMPVFRAYATIKATLQGSLTADAWILSLTGNGGSLSARAVLFASLAATTTANAVKLKVASGSFTAQAVIRVTIASSFTASAVVKRTATATFTADAVFIRARAGSFTADAIRRRTQTGAFTGDAIRRSTTTGSIAASAVLRKTILPTFTVDSVVLKARTGTFAANAVVLKVQVAAIAVDVVLKATRTSSFSMAAIIARSGSGSFTANAYILSPTAGANTFFADAIVKASRAGSTTAGATILRARSGSFTAAALILATRASSTTANAVVKASLTRTFAADAVIKASRSGTFTVDAFRAQTQTGSFTASALVRRSQFGTLPISAVLRGPRSASFFADAWKTKIVSASFTASAWTVATRTAGFATAATIRRQQTQTFTADAVRRASRAGVTTADATTRRTASASITADASIVGAGQNSFKADAVKRESFAGSLTADAQIDDGKRAGDFTVDAVLDVLRSSFPLTSTLSVAKMTASITGPHLSATVGSHHLQSRLGWSRSERSFTANAVIA